MKASLLMITAASLTLVTVSAMTVNFPGRASPNKFVTRTLTTGFSLDRATLLAKVIDTGT